MTKFLALAALVPTLASAQTMNLSEGSEALSLIKDFEILEVKVIPGKNNGCPDDAPADAFCPAVIVPPRTIISINFPLNGCLDELGPVSFSTRSLNTQPEKLEVSIAAWNIHNKDSKVAYCLQLPVANRVIEIFGAAFTKEQIVLSTQELAAPF